MALLFVYTEDYKSKDQYMEISKVDTIIIKNENLLAKIQEAEKKMADLPFANYGIKLKRAIEDYLKENKSNHERIASSILPLLIENKKEQKNKIFESYDLVITQFRNSKFEFISAMLLFEKENNLYNFDRKEIEKRLDEMK
jgi:hypothetical protein